MLASVAAIHAAVSLTTAPIRPHKVRRRHTFLRADRDACRGRCSGEDDSGAWRRMRADFARGRSLEGRKGAVGETYGKIWRRIEEWGALNLRGD